jgi:hypothetical protein
MVSRSSAAQRARSRVNAVAKASARSKVARACAAAAASGTRLRRLYHFERETPSASHGRRGGRRPYPVRPAPALRAQAGFLGSDCTSYWTKSNAWYPLSCAPYGRYGSQVSATSGRPRNRGIKWPARPANKSKMSRRPGTIFPTRKWIRFYDFEVVYEINPWMEGQFANTDSCGVNDIIASAMEEHGHFGES